MTGSEMEYPFTFAAHKGGYFTIPEMVVQSLPGSNVTIKLEAYFNHSDTESPLVEEYLYEIKFEPCLATEILNFTGQCQVCNGPEFYLLEPKQSQPVANTLKLQECLACESEFYDCYGDNDVKAKHGYQIYINESLAVIECDLLNSY